jgi:CBS domain-containing protein
MPTTRHIPLAEAGPTVSDVMLRGARAVSPESGLADVRETFANPRVKLILVADGERFVGILTPADVPAEGDGPVADYVNADAPRVAPGDPIGKALDLVAATGMDRIPVVDADDQLLGLVCWNTRRSVFCA